MGTWPLLLLHMLGSDPVQKHWKADDPKAVMPVLPQNFSARGILAVDGVIYGGFSAEIPLWNLTQRGSEGRMMTTAVNKYAPVNYKGTGADLLNLSMIVQGDEFLTMNDLCYPQPSFWRYPTFEWLENATYGGMMVVDGFDCDVWFDETHAAAFVGDRPLQYNFSVYTFTFLAFENDDSSLPVFDTTTCYDPPICDEFQLPESEIVYLFHPKNNFDIGGQNVADLLGEASFLCESLAANQTGSLSGDAQYDWLTMWRLEFTNRSVGLYENCNGYDPPVCLGVNDALVGREAAMGIGKPLAGQCEPNKLTGSWFSLPQCDENCPWTKMERVKTINGSCLL